MDEKELRELLYERLHMELNLFKNSMLQRTKEDIYKASYKIEVFVNVYEILLEDVGNMDAGTAQALLYRKQGILEGLYQEWLGREDSSFEELKTYAGRELKVMVQEAVSCRKDGEDGTEFNPAAQGR